MGPPAEPVAKPGDKLQPRRAATHHDNAVQAQLFCRACFETRPGRSAASSEPVNVSRIFAE